MSVIDLRIAAAALAWRRVRLRFPSKIDLHMRMRRELDALCDEALRAIAAAPVGPVPAPPRRDPYRDD